MLKLKHLFPLFGLLMPALLFGFSFTVTPTNETCPGNGTLTFTASNTAPGGSIEYFIYKLPNAIVPYASTTGSVLGGLTAGDYHVVAIETVGSATTSQQQDVSIASSVVPLEFTVQSLNQACATVSNIAVNVTSGTAASYEIFDGPITFASQASNVFSNLPVGIYKIRVFDACGIGVVSTFTVTLNPAGLTVGDPVFGNTSPPSCNFVVALQTVTPTVGTVIAYPLAIQYTVHPPNGDPAIIINNTLASGDPLLQQISATLPTYINEQYTYDIAITDACNTLTARSFTSNQDIDIRPTIISLVCNDNYFELNMVNFTPPYNLNFAAFPAGFDPAVANPSYPGPYSDIKLTFGDEDHPVPLGVYSIAITDACGKTKTVSFEILDIPPVPSVVPLNNGCLSNSGKIAINIPHYALATAVVIAAPTNYPFALPHDVSDAIDIHGALLLDPVPLGDYVIALTDFCSSAIQPVSVSIPTYVNQTLLVDERPGCELQKSSIRVASGNASKLTSLSISAAPNGFPFSLPYDGTSNITSSGDFYMRDLPSGNYTITATDACGFTNTTTTTLAGYAISDSTFNLQTNCGTFDLSLHFVSNATAGETYWLQKDLGNNSWGQPLTGNPYVENTLPDDSNSYRLNNNATNLNLSFNGTFRIVRSFFSYNNGSEVTEGVTPEKSCIEILQPTLHFDESLEITDAHRMPCSPTGSLDVIVDVNGALPLHFTITEKDGVPIAFDNGTSNVFANLDAAVYTFQVEDNCGNIVNRIFDVAALGSLISANKPTDLLDCVTTITHNETFDLSTQSSVILGAQSTTDHTLSYFTSIENAQANTNAIANLANFNPQQNPQTIYAAVRYNALPNCYELTTFDLFVGQTPSINVSATILGCGSQPVVVNVSGNNLPTTTYLWSDGSTDPEVSVTTPGITNLTVTATNTYGNNEICSVTKDIEVIISEAPVIDRIDTVDWTENENSIAIISSDSEHFEYSIDGGSFQSEPIFQNLEPGEYTITIKDKFGCGTIAKTVWLLNYPKFFTPNADHYNDLWQIKNSSNEPNFKVEIFDRYGKLLKVLYRDQGWDGLYNGRAIFADDYWFVVHRQDGKIYKGHFTLKR